LSEGKLTDHGVIRLEDGRYPSLTQSIGVHSNGCIYTCPWIPSFDETNYHVHRQQCDLISLENPLK